MDALLIFATILIAFLLLSVLGTAFGAEGRDGFAGDRLAGTVG